MMLHYLVYADTKSCCFRSSTHFATRHLCCTVRLTCSTANSHSPGRYVCCSPLDGFDKQRTNCNLLGRPLGLSGWFYIPWHHRLWTHHFASQSQQRPVLTLVSHNVNHSAYCGPPGRTSSGPLGRLSACERTFDSPQTTRSFLRHHLVTVNSRYEQLGSQQIPCLPCSAPLRSPQATRQLSHVDMPQRALSSHTHCRIPGDRVTVDILSTLQQTVVSAPAYLTTRSLPAIIPPQTACLTWQMIVAHTTCKLFSLM
jgi:hypothetical protein